MFKLSMRSKLKLSTVKPELQEVVKLALTKCKIDFGVSDGKRSKVRQAYYLKTGKSKTMNSKHLTGDAVDLYAYVKGKASWEWYHYELINKAMQEAADDLKVNILWGGSWTGFRDGCHFELA